MECESSMPGGDVLRCSMCVARLGVLLSPEIQAIIKPQVKPALISEKYFTDETKVPEIVQSPQNLRVWEMMGRALLYAIRRVGAGCRCHYGGAVGGAVKDVQLLGKERNVKSV